MNLLSPWFLLGALAIAGPIIFHLIRRAVRERIPFSSLMFLKPTPPRITRKRKLEHLWLLLLRCLALLLLATGFARPFFLDEDSPAAPADGARQLALLLDTSASMRREGVWEEARAALERHLDDVSPADQVAIIAFDRQPRTVVSFADWSSWSLDQRAALARERLATLSPRSMGTQLGLALTSVAEQFLADAASDDPSARREMVLITDLQEGARLDGLQGYEWPANVNAKVERVTTRRQANAGLEILPESTGTSAETNAVRVQVVNARDSEREKFQLSWAGAGGEAMDIYLPPGQSRTFAAPGRTANTAGEIRLTGDQEDFDNRSYFAAPEVERISIAWFGAGSPNDPEKPRYYVQRVFTETPRRQVRLVQPVTNSIFSAELLNEASFAVVAEKLAASEASALREWLAQGRTALLILTSPEMGPTLAALANLPQAQLVEIADDYALLGEIDFTHPLFAPFADPRYSDFTQIHFWKHRRWEIPAEARARVLARFDDKSPALAQLPVGKGNLLVLASGWHPGDSQLAVSSKFPPLMQLLLDWSGANVTTRYQLLTGDAIASPVSGRTTQVQWRKPDGTERTLPAGTAFIETEQPGVYTASFDGKERRFAVNLPLDESRTAPLSLDELARLGVPLQSTPELSAVHVATRTRNLQHAELESRQKLWRWLIVGVLGVTLLEIVSSGWLARRITTAKAT